MKAVTTFSQEGYEKYGRKSLETFVKYWPINIIAYYEEDEPDFKHEKIEYRKFFEIPGAVAFLTNISRLPQAHGMVPEYNYMYDVNKFCRKMFCQIDSFNEGGKIIWLDNDVLTEKKIPKKFLESLFKDHLVFLGRPGAYTESGFVGFDTEHPDFERFAERYINTLRKGEIFTLKDGWTDCHAFDYAREGKGTSLSNWKKGDNFNVWKSTVLNDYMTHFKGNRKNLI